MPATKRCSHQLDTSAHPSPGSGASSTILPMDCAHLILLAPLLSASSGPPQSAPSGDPQGGESEAGAPDAIWWNGVIHTLDAGFARTEAFAVKDGRILALGTSAEVRKLAGAK